jgi:hypothetical protein
MTRQLKTQKSLPFIGGVGLGLAHVDFKLPRLPTQHGTATGPRIPQSGSESSYNCFNPDDNNFRLRRFGTSHASSSTATTPALSSFDDACASTPPTSVELDYCSTDSEGEDCYQVSPTLNRRNMQRYNKVGKGSPSKCRARKVLNPQEQEHYW